MTEVATRYMTFGKKIKREPKLLDKSKMGIMNETEINRRQQEMGRRLGYFWITDIVFADDFGGWIRLRQTDGLR